MESIPQKRLITLYTRQGLYLIFDRLLATSKGCATRVVCLRTNEEFSVLRAEQSILGRALHGLPSLAVPTQCIFRLCCPNNHGVGIIHQVRLALDNTRSSTEHPKAGGTRLPTVRSAQTSI